MLQLDDYYPTVGRSLTCQVSCHIKITGMGSKYHEQIFLLAAL